MADGEREGDGNGRNVTAMSDTEEAPQPEDVSMPVRVAKWRSFFMINHNETLQKVNYFYIHIFLIDLFTWVDIQLTKLTEHINCISRRWIILHPYTCTMYYCIY